MTEKKDKVLVLGSMSQYEDDDRFWCSNILQ